MQERDMYNILKEALYEFPVVEVKVNIPDWISILNPNHYVKKTYIDKIIEISRLEDLNDQIYSSEEVYEKFRNILDEYSFEKVKSLLEVYRRRKTQLYDQVMNYQNMESKLIR